MRLGAYSPAVVPHVQSCSTAVWVLDSAAVFLAGNTFISILLYIRECPVVAAAVASFPVGWKFSTLQRSSLWQLHEVSEGHGTLGHSFRGERLSDHTILLAFVAVEQICKADHR